MSNYLCPDDVTVTVNSSDELELQYDSEFFEMTADGLAFINTLGYMRDFTPVLNSNATPITMGSSTMVGQYTRVRCEGQIPAYGTSDSQDYYLTVFNFKLTLGSGFSIPTGTLNWDHSILGGATLRVAPNNSDTGIFGKAEIVDVSAGSKYPRILYQNGHNGYGVEMRGYTGASVTNSSLFTFATGDTITVDGVCFNPVLRTDALT